MECRVSSDWSQVHVHTLDERPGNKRVSEASETLSGVYKFELMRYVYIYVYVWRYVCHNSSACHIYVM